MMMRNLLIAISGFVGLWFLASNPLLFGCQVASGQETDSPGSHDATLVPWTNGDVDVTSVRVLIRDGWYNMPNDLAIWKNFYWLAYRRGTGHSSVRRVFGNPPQLQGGHSFIVVKRSNDLRRWHKEKVFESPEGIVDGSGAGSGYLCPAADRLQIFFRVQWQSRPSKVYTAWTDDGVTWTEPVVTRYGELYPQPRHPRYREGKFYCAFWHPGHDNGPFDLCVSEDGIKWTKHAQIAVEVPERLTDESDLHWLPDGELWCGVVARR